LTSTSYQQKFWDKHSKSYANKPIKYPLSYQKKLKRTQQYLNQSSKVLEIGCGTGMTAIKHSGYAKHIVATDYSEKMIDIAQARKVDSNIHNIDFHLIDAFSACALGRFDMILALSLFHLVDEREALLKQIFNSLEAGGTFVSSTHCFEQRSKRLIKAVNWISTTFKKTPYCHIFSISQWMEALRNAGFRVIESWQSEEDFSIFIVCEKPFEKGKFEPVLNQNKQVI
jgi:SAM-dependent methyltransferase